MFLEGGADAVRKGLSGGVVPWPWLLHSYRYRDMLCCRDDVFESERCDEGAELGTVVLSGEEFMLCCFVDFRISTMKSSLTDVCKGRHFRRGA